MSKMKRDREATEDEVKSDITFVPKRSAISELSWNKEEGLERYFWFRFFLAVFCVSVGVGTIRIAIAIIFFLLLALIFPVG